MGKRIHNLITGGMVCLIIAIWWFGGMNFLEHTIQDRIYQSEKPDAISTDVVIVGIDEATLETLGRWPYTRSLQAKVLETIASGDPAVIGVDILMTEETTLEEDKVFANVLRQYDNIVLPVFATFASHTQNGKFIVESIAAPIDSFANESNLAHINVFPDVQDGVVRKGLDSFEANGQKYASFSRVIYDLYAERHGLKKLGTLPDDQFSRFPIDFTGQPESFEMLSYSAIEDGSVPPEYFKDKIVLIGPYATAMVDDYYYTPLNKQLQMFGIEIHANIIQMYLDNRMKSQGTPIVNLTILLVMAVLVSFGVRRLTMGKAALYTLAVAGAWVGVGRVLYQNGYIVDLVYPIVMAGALFLITAAVKYISELQEKRRITNLFGRYVSPQVVKEILREDQSAIGLGGTRKELSVLFVDIRGFTPLSEALEPEEIVSILNDYLNLTARSIFEFGGTVDKFIGDATMAIFNAPLPLENHPLMAARAAWAMKEGADALEKDLLERYGKTVKFGIGLNFGDAVVGNIGATFRMDYTAIGDTVNTSARLESNAKPGQILMSAAFYECVKDHVLVEDMGGLKVKGKAEPIQVYSLIGLKLTEE